MFTTSETSIISLIVLGAVGILGWGFYRANLWQTGNLSLVTIGGVDNLLAIFLGCFVDLHQYCGHPVLVGGFGLVIHLAGQSTQSSWSRCGVARTSNGEGSQIPPSQQVKQKIHGKRQLITKPAQSPLNVDVVPIPDEDISDSRNFRY